MGERNELRLGELRATLEQQLQSLQADNAAKLEAMRATVDEKLHATLETRLTESFGNVTRMLAQVHQGLGDMSKLAADVGGLQRVLTNVKSRGIFGEVQLAGLLEQVFAPDQYAANVATIPGSSERVEFAVRFPGSGAPTRWCGCRSTPSSRARTTSACWTRRNAPTSTPRVPPATRWSGACARRPSASAANTWPRRTPPNSRCCSCPPKACTRRCCAAPGCSRACSASSASPSPARPPCWRC